MKKKEQSKTVNKEITLETMSKEEVQKLTLDVAKVVAKEIKSDINIKFDGNKALIMALEIMGIIPNWKDRMLWSMYGLGFGTIVTNALYMIFG